MQIRVVSATGTGYTTLSAFDNALKSAGVYNYNIIALSSIIPPRSKVTKEDRIDMDPGEFGWRLYVVKADIRSRELNKVIAAGLGWYLLDDGCGLFVEHTIETVSPMDVAEDEVKVKIHTSLADLCAFRDVQFDKKKVHSSVAVCQVTSRPRCALALAVYKAEPW